MGLIHLDAGVIIGFLNRNDMRHEASRAVISEAMNLGDRLEAAASVYAECHVGPMRSGSEAIRLVEKFFEQFPVSVVAMGQAIAFEAARLRAVNSSLRLPDALVIATAVERHADRLVTTDNRWPLNVTKHSSLKIQRI